MKKLTRYLLRAFAGGYLLCYAGHILYVLYFNSAHHWSHVVGFPVAHPTQIALHQLSLILPLLLLVFSFAKLTREDDNTVKQSSVRMIMAVSAVLMLLFAVGYPFRLTIPPLVRNLFFVFYLSDAVLLLELVLGNRNP